MPYIGGLDLLEYLAEELDLKPLMASTIRNKRGDYGNAILTKMDVQCIRQFDLSLPNREPRNAMLVEVKTGSDSIYIVNTHLGLKRKERWAQIKALSSHLSNLNIEKAILLGDFNEWGSVLNFFHHFKDIGSLHFSKVNTFPSRWPTLALDRICLINWPGICNFESINSAIARCASDHLPLKGVLNT